MLLPSCKIYLIILLIPHNLLMTVLNIKNKKTLNVLYPPIEYTLFILSTLLCLSYPFNNYSPYFKYAIIPIKKSNT